MPSVQSNSNPAHTDNNRPQLPDFAALAASLQETAQALLAQAAKEPGESAKPPTHNEGETRSFYFPPASVHMERELLRRYRADDFQGLLEEAHILLVGLVKIMQSVHKDVRVKGYVISSLGSQLDHASALLLRMRHVYDKVLPVQR